MKRVLSCLQEPKLPIAHEKSEWHKLRVNFLGYNISANRVAIEQEKNIAELEWDTPEPVKDIQSSLGITNFHNDSERATRSLLVH